MRFMLLYSRQGRRKKTSSKYSPSSLKSSTRMISLIRCSGLRFKTLEEKKKKRVRKNCIEMHTHIDRRSVHLILLTHNNNDLTHAVVTSFFNQLKIRILTGSILKIPINFTDFQPNQWVFSKFNQLRFQFKLVDAISI